MGVQRGAEDHIAVRMVTAAGLSSKTTATHTEPSPSPGPQPPLPTSGLPSPSSPPCPHLPCPGVRGGPSPISPGANVEQCPFNVAGGAAEINGTLEFCWGLPARPAGLP